MDLVITWINHSLSISLPTGISVVTSPDYSSWKIRLNLNLRQFICKQDNPCMLNYEDYWREVLDQYFEVRTRCLKWKTCKNLTSSARTHSLWIIYFLEHILSLSTVKLSIVEFKLITLENLIWTLSKMIYCVASTHIRGAWKPQSGLLID